MVVGGAQKAVEGGAPLKRKDGIDVTIELSTAIIISVVSLGFSVYMGLKNSKRTDNKEIEERVRNNTQINMKLDSINSATQDIKNEISSMRTDINKHNDKIIVLEQSCKQAHKRIDEIASRLNIEEKDKE